MHDIVLKISFLDTNSQNWSNGSHLKLWQVIVKIRHRCERISNILSRGWRACKNWFFMLTTFLAWGIFSIHQIKKKVKKRPEPKKFLYQKIIWVMSVNHAKEFFKYILYFKTFLPEPHMAHIAPILKTKFSNSKFISFLIYIFRKSLIDIGPWKVGTP